MTPARAHALKRTASLALVAGLAAATAPAWGDDFNPPPWRGLPYSVEAEWEFLAPPVNPFFITPDSFGTVGGPLYNLNPNILPHADLGIPNDWAWVPADGDGGLLATNPGGSSIAFNLPNYIDPLPEKWIRIQITYTGTVSVAEVLGTDNGVLVPGVPVSQGGVTGQRWFDYHIFPNPDWEQIVLFATEGSVIDQVYIDTISIPAPAGVLAIAGMGLCWRRRR